jgi:hypothetical protein
LPQLVGEQSRRSALKRRQTGNRLRLAAGEQLANLLKRRFPVRDIGNRDKRERIGCQKRVAADLFPP